MKSVLEDMKNQDYNQVYLFYGPENYLKMQYKGRLRRAIFPEEDTMNCSMFEGKKTDPREIIDLAETMPFFAEKRLIICQDTGFFKNKCEEMADYMERLPEYLCLLFVEEEVDKRSRMFKAVKKAGRVVEFGTQDSQTLIRWVLGILKREGKQITQRDMELFLTMTGTDMGNIERELEKLLCYTMGRDVITTQDIQEICTTQITNKIFEMIRAVTDKNQKRALDLYYDLLALKEPPMRILFLLARQFNLILQIKELSALGFDEKTMAQKTGLQSFVVRSYLKYSNRYSTQMLRQAVQDCVQAEEHVKTGKIQDVLSVELLLIQYSA